VTRRAASVVLAGLAVAAAARAAPPAPMGALPRPQPIFDPALFPAWEPEDEALLVELARSLYHLGDEGAGRALASLRSMRDPALAPLLARLATSERAVLRVQGVLGLAELRSPPEVDLLMVRRAGDVREQLAVLGEALRGGMIRPEQLEDVARWPGVDDTLAVLVLGQVRRAGGLVEPDELQRRLSSPNRAAAVLAAVELVQQGGGGPALRVLDEVMALPPGTRAAALVRVLDYIGQERLERLAPFVERVLTEARDDPGVRQRALAALVAIAPGSAAAEWSASYAAGDAAERARLGLMALSAGVTSGQGVGAEYLAALRAATDPLVAQMARAGAAATAMLRRGGEGEAGGPDAGPVVGLVELDVPAATLWALELARKAGPPHATPIRAAVIGRAALAVAGSAPVEPWRLELAMRAARELALDDPQALAGRLRAAGEAGDEPLLTALLAGVLESGVSPPASFTEACRGRGGLPAALCELVQARGRGEAGLTDPEGLARIALSGPAAPDVVRVQAAWLALKARGRTQAALARLTALAPAPGADPAPQPPRRPDN